MFGTVYKLAQCIWNTCLKTVLNESLVVQPWLRAATTRTQSNWMPVTSKTTVTKLMPADV